LGLAFFVMAAFAGGRRFFATLAVLAVIAGSVWAWVPGIGARASTIVDASFPSNAQRASLWRANWQIFIENPVVGVGYGMNEIYVGKYLDKLGLKGVEGGHAHNNYLQFISGTGFLGLAFYLLFSAYFFWISARAWLALSPDRRWERGAILAAIGAQVALHAGGLTECNFKDAEVNHQFLMILAMVAAIDRSLTEAPLAPGLRASGGHPATATAPRPATATATATSGQAG
jgi:O-antigen ligase